MGRGHPIVLPVIYYLRSTNCLEGWSAQEFPSGGNGHNPILLDDDDDSLADSSLHGTGDEPPDGIRSSRTRDSGNTSLRLIITSEPPFSLHTSTLSMYQTARD